MEAQTGEPSSSAASERITGKRRIRVSRACDECRVRKIRCDGLQRCGNCETYDRYCSYNVTLGRLGTVQRSKILEDRLRRAHAYIRELQNRLPPSAHVDPEALFGFPPEVQQEGSEEKEDDSEDGQGLEFLVQPHPHMTSEGDKQRASFYGSASGFSFLAQTSALFDENAPGPEDNGEHDTGQLPEWLASTELYDRPLPNKQASEMSGPISHLLPLRNTARRSMRIVAVEVYPLYQFMTEEVFEMKSNRIYSLEPFEFDHHDHAFLPLFYTVNAIGLLYSLKYHRKHGCERTTMQAMRYFIAARYMLDITRCRELVHIQTLVCFVLFLLSTARITTAHTYVGLAVSAALKLGLHCSTEVNDFFSELERSRRRKVMWTVVKLDLYTASILGLPPVTKPMDYEITSNELIQVVIDEARKNESESPQDKFPLLASCKQLQLMKITCMTIYTLYLRSRFDNSLDKLPRLSISNAKIEALAKELRIWRQSLTELIRTNSDDRATSITIKYDLDMSESCAYIVLCRPFLHYLGVNARGIPVSGLKLQWSYMCVHASRNAIQRSIEMLREGYLAPASWYAMYTVFMACISLVFFLAIRGDAPERDDIHETAVNGIRILATTVCQDTGSNKCLNVLRSFAKRLGPRVDLDVDEIIAGIAPLCKRDDLPQPGAGKARRAGSGQSSDPQQSSSQSTVVPSTQPLSEPIWAHATPVFPQGPVYDANTQQSVEGAGSGMFDLDAVHMPFLDSFNWTNEPSLLNYSSSEPTAPTAVAAPSTGLLGSQHPLSYEDIDNFMYDNP